MRLREGWGCAGTDVGACAVFGGTLFGYAVSGGGAVQECSGSDVTADKEGIAGSGRADRYLRGRSGTEGGGV